MSETKDRAVEVVVQKYRHTKGAKMVDGGEVFWDAEFRLCVALYGPDGLLLALYRITNQGVTRGAKKLPGITYPLTRDNPHLLGMINTAAAMSNGDGHGQSESE